MYTDTEGIIFRQIKTVNGRRMILLFSKKYGKISAGTGISEKGRGKSALAMRPFTYGKYELYKNRDSYNINGAEVLKSYYSIGEDVEKYMAASYALEFTERLLAENDPVPQLFVLLTDFFAVMETRKKRYGTLVLAYQLKALAVCGNMPHLDSCVLCGGELEQSEPCFFDVREGGLVCGKCRTGGMDRGGRTETAGNSPGDRPDSNPAANRENQLIYQINFGIVNILRYFLKNPLKSLERLALDEPAERLLRRIL